MIIQIDWFGCEPNSNRELYIHKTLENLNSLKSISRASLRIEEDTQSSPPFRLVLILSMPGPDVLAHGIGHTFDEALHRLEESAHKTLERRSKMAKMLNGAPRGVKALHRG
ncbi:MAG: hypothetical protein RL015_1300 [Verrucomicrobiota bacterium]|jgi:hypothetical protein